MTKYMVFSFHSYYPAGGMQDFHSSHDTFEQALEAARATVSRRHDWAQIWSMERPGEYYELFGVDKGKWVEPELQDTDGPRQWKWVSERIISEKWEKIE